MRRVRQIARLERVHFARITSRSNRPATQIARGPGWTRPPHSASLSNPASSASHSPALFQGSLWLSGRPPTTSWNSLFISISDSFVLSVCTGATARYGRCPRASHNRMLAPYDQCLSSRKFIFNRAPKLPPSPSFYRFNRDLLRIAFRRCNHSRDNHGLLRARLVNQIDRALSREIHRLHRFLWNVSRFPCREKFSSFGVTSLSVVSPTITSVALFGLNHESWNFTRSSRVIFPTLALVPEPVNGFPYA